MELGKLGTVTDSEGNAQYRPWENPLLQHGVLGINPVGFGATPMNPGTFATPAAAAALARALGGLVVADPMSARWNVTARVLAVQLENGAIVNAGALCSILGNDCAFANARMKSGAICELLGVPFDATVADQLYNAVKAEV